MVRSFIEGSANMFDGYDDGYDMELEEILAEEQETTDFENPDACRDEIDMAIAKVQDDLYFMHKDAYLEEIETGMDEFRVKPEVDDHHDWRDENNQAIAKVRQGGVKIRK
jgi:hypothetical protein